MKIVLDQGPLVEGGDDQNRSVLGQILERNVKVMLNGVGEDRLNIDQG